MSIKLVAEKAGVSVATVSRVLNHPETVAQETKEHILSVIDTLDYTPNWLARSLKLNKTSVIALLIPDILDMGYMEIAKGVEAIAHQKSYHLMLCTTDENKTKEKQYAENFIKRKVDGIILVSSTLKSKDLIQIKNQCNALVLIGKNADHAGENIVYMDYKLAASEAIAHLIEVGHHKIAMIYGSRPMLENSYKIEGFKETLLEKGIAIPEGYLVESENSIEGGYLAASKILNHEKKADAIFITSDTMAIGVMEKIKQTGLQIPEDIAVVGFDNLKISAYLEPKLTTIAKPMYRMGLVATRLLFDLIEDGEPGTREAQEILIQSKLKIRKSCGHQDRLKEIF